MAFFFLAQYAITKIDITGGMHGLTNISPPAIGGFELSRSAFKDTILEGFVNIAWYFFLMLILILCIIVSVNIKRSRLGRSFTAVRDNYIAAASLGINVPWVKLQSFFIGGLFAGMMVDGGWSAARGDFVYSLRRNEQTEEQELVRYRLVEPF